MTRLYRNSWLLWYNLPTLLGRLMVGQRTLDPFILVRIQARQHHFPASKIRFYHARPEQGIEPSYKQYNLSLKLKNRFDK